MALFNRKSRYDRMIDDISGRINKGLATDWSPVQQWLSGDDFPAQSSILSDFGRIGNPYVTSRLIYVCVSKIARSISQVPIEIIDAKGNPVEGTPEGKLFRKPYELYTTQYLIQSIVSRLELRGKAFVIFQEPVRGVPSSMFVAGDDMCRPVPNAERSAISHYEYGKRGRGKQLEPEYVGYVRYWHPTDPLDGLGPLEAAKLHVLEEWYANTFNVQFFKNGGLIKGFFNKKGVRPPTPGEVETMEEVTKQKTHGLANAQKVPVLGNLDYVQIGASQKDMDFVAMLHEDRDAVFDIFGTPKAMFGYTDTTFNNMHEAKRYFWQETALPKMRLIAAMFNDRLEDYGSKYRMRFNTSTIPELQVDRISAAPSAKLYYDMGLPFPVINDVLGLGFPDDVQLEERAMPFSLGAVGGLMKARQVVEDLIRREKAIAIDPVLMALEQDKSARNMVSHEKKLYAAWRHFWTEVGEQLKAKLAEILGTEKAAKGIKPEELAVLVDYIQAAQWDDEVKAALDEYMQATFTAGAKRTYFGLGIAFTMPHDLAVLHVKNRGVKISYAVEEVRSIILDAIKSGDATETIAETIAAKIDVAKKRGRLIARTETTNAFNAGRIGGMKELGIRKKKWVHSHDTTVRDSHRIDQTVPTESSFTLSNGVTVMYPGDGPASEACNCRCTVISVIE